MLQSHTWTVSTTEILFGQQCDSVVSYCYLCLNKGELSDSFRTKKNYGYGSERFWLVGETILGYQDDKLMGFVV